MTDRIRVHVKVTEQDIAEGIRRNAYLCPIAKAVQRAFEEKFPDADYLCTEVDGGIRVGLGYNSYKLLGEEERNLVAGFVKSFDAYEPVSQFEADFEFENFYSRKEDR